LDDAINSFLTSGGYTNSVVQVKKILDSLSVDVQTSINSGVVSKGIGSGFSVFSNKRKVYLLLNNGYAGSGINKITIHNLHGKTLYTKSIYRHCSNKPILIWDGSELSGNSAGKGCYIVRLETNGKVFFSPLFFTK